MKRRRLSVLIAAAVMILAAPAAAQPDERAAEQARLESGDDLAPRARQILFRARNRLEAGEPAAASRLLDEWLDGSAERDHHLLRYTRGIARLGAGDESGALADLKQAVALEPRFARAWLRLGETAHGLGEYDAAAEAFARGYDLSPDPRPEFLHYSGVCHLLAGRADTAVAVLSRLLDLTGGDAPLEWHRALVAACLEGSAPAACAGRVETMLAGHASDPEAWLLAAQYHAALEDYRAAAVAMTVAGYLRPLAPEQWDQLGDLYAMIGVPREAARCYERALAVEPGPSGLQDDPAQATRRLASAWAAAHDLDAARAALRSGLDKSPSAELWALAGDVELMADDFAAARDCFDRAVALDPDFGRGHLMLGWCAVELDRRDEARRHLRRARDFPEQAEAAAGLLARLAP